MKKVIIVLFFLTILFISSKEEEFIIPDEAIRFRVIANSNTLEDQAMKLEIKNNIESLLKTDLLEAETKEEAKSDLQNSIPSIEKMIDQYNIPYQVHYGDNYFPEKKYKGVTYQAGNYESLVVTLGKGAGNNWWCVMFPPLCLIDEENIEGDVDYRLFVKDLFEKYL